MNISLVFPPFYLESLYNLPPLGLINLAASVDETRHKVHVTDFVLAIRLGDLPMGKDIYDRCASMILDENPDVVGFSAQSTTYPAVIQIARRIKLRNNRIHIVVGGHTASFVDVQTLERYPCIDSVVRGEGEVTFPEWISAIEEQRERRSVAGMTFRDGSEIIRTEDRPLIEDLNELPLPRYDFLPSFSIYRDVCELPRSIAILEVGRGCPHHCVYCSESVMWRRRTRRFSVERLIQEMGYLHKEFGAECFLLAYDQFTASRAFVSDFCRAMIREKLNHLPWYCISRLDSVDAGLLELMREAGCESMCYGIDSGSERTLAFIRKNIDKGILYQRVLETTDQGIVPTLSYVIGFPEEREEDVDATLNLSLRTGILGNVNTLLQMPTVLPGTDLHRRYLDRLVRKVDTYFALGLEFDNGRRLESDDDLINSDREIYSAFYNIPSMGRTLSELALFTEYFPLIVNLYPKTFFLLILDTGKSPSNVFLEWLAWLGAKSRNGKLTCSARDCYEHFTAFVERLRISGEYTFRDHLSDVLKYETCGLEVGKLNSVETNFHIDLHRIREFKPLRSQAFLLESFDYPLPEIVRNMRSASFFEQYPLEHTILVFQQKGERLEVTEINAFGRDFLNLCSGEISLAHIAEQLYPRYGSTMSRKEFFGECVDAVQDLGSISLLQA